MYDYYTGKLTKEKTMNLVMENGKFASESEVEKRKKLSVKYLENSNLWQGVLSFNNDYINDNIDIHKLEQELATNILPKFFKKCGFKDSKKMFYQLSLHTDTDNLHFHFSFMEKEPNYVYSKNKVGYRRSGELSQVEIDFLKNQVIHTIEKEKIIETIGKYVDSIYVKGKQLKCIYGKSYIEEKLGDFIFEISPDSFFQVNSAQAKNLYDLVKKYANLKKTDSVLDLYCGTGTIGLYVSPYVHKVLGIEVNEQAIMDAKRNQKKNCIENVAFICGNVSQMLSTIKEYYDVIIVDPPRSGLDKETIRFLKSCGAKRIIYVSCDPVTLARDLNILSEVYGVLELTPVDMFPNTYHVECVCVLNRR